MLVGGRWRPYSSAMSELTKVFLDEDEIPTHWYNIAADFPTPPPPHLHPGTQQPLQAQDLAARLRRVVDFDYMNVMLHDAERGVMSMRPVAANGSERTKDINSENSCAAAVGSHSSVRSRS